MDATTFDVVNAIKPLLGNAMDQIVDLITALMPYTIGVALFGAGIFMVRRFISNGVQSLG